MAKSNYFARISTQFVAENIRKSMENYNGIDAVSVTFQKPLNASVTQGK